MENDKLDNRNLEDFIKQIKTLSKSYTPEWDFQTEHPDAGSVISMIFAKQMAQNIKYYSSSLMRQQINLVNLLGLTLTPATPSSGIVTMGLADNTVEGVRIPKETRLLCQKEGGEEGDLIFETQEEVYITEAKITHILGISGIQGKIIPYLGNMHIPLAAENQVRTESFYKTRFRLFDFQEPGISQSGILLYHRTFLSMEHTQLYLRFEGNHGERTWEQVFGNPVKYRFCYLGKNGLIPVKHITWDHDIACLLLEEKPEKIRYENEEYGLVYIEALTQPETDVFINDIRISSAGGSSSPEYLCHEGKELGQRDVCPFGKKIDLYEEFYIGNDFVFSQKESEIHIEFDLDFWEELVSYGSTKELELKPIQRMPKHVMKYRQYETHADQVSIEYFNGLGWKPVKELLKYQEIFNGSQKGHILLSFLCPPDWRELEIGAYYGRVLRFQLNQAVNCYMTPCLHFIPVLNHIRLSYSYEGIWRTPERIQVLHGTCLKDVTNQFHMQGSFLAAAPLPYEGDGLYLGFDKPLAQGPVSIFFQLERNSEIPAFEIQYEYSTKRGFLPLKTSDHTNGMVHSGTLTFLPPSDFSDLEIEGVSCFWIRIRKMASDNEGDLSVSLNNRCPEIRNIIPNAAVVQNIKTEPEESFYIDSPVPNMKFELGDGNILQVLVYVNERNSLTREAIEELIREYPHKVKAERDNQGEINRFFVLWEEVANFNQSTAWDRHYVLDRTNNYLIFGNGVHGKIPSERIQEAFTVTLRCCDGEKGNVSGKKINRFESNYLFIRDISNPANTYGGCNMETMDAALKRGANLLNSRNRLVSTDDYVREAKAFSDRIDKVSCIVEKNRMILILLMKDFEMGSDSFYFLKEPLTQRLLRLSEITCKKDQIIVKEPLYVKINVEAWVYADKNDRIFEIQDKLQNSVFSFLNPLTQSDRPGFSIGTLPEERQISMMLHSIKKAGVLSHFAVTASYEDEMGFHETGLDEIPHNPYMIGINGVHKIHISVR